MASIITATVANGLTQSADNSGVLQLASGVGNLVTVPAVTGTAMVSGNMPAFSAYPNATQSNSAGTWSKMPFNTEEFDTASCYNTSNYRFTPNVAGYYQVNASVESTGNSASSYYLCAIYKNGSSFKYGQNYLSSVSSGPSATASTLIYLNGSTDYIELYAIGQNAWTSGSNALASYFQACLVRTA